MSSYQLKHRNYYLNHRDQILAEEKEKKRWISYYQANKERIKQRRQQRKMTITAVAPANDTETIYAFINLDSVVSPFETTEQIVSAN
jgi:ABC-type Fe3+-hydroxamate transport system substrate-binding protein